MASKEFERGAACQRAHITVWLETHGYAGIAAEMYADIANVKVKDPLEEVWRKKSEDRNK